MILQQQSYSECNPFTNLVLLWNDHIAFKACQENSMPLSQWMQKLCCRNGPGSGLLKTAYLEVSWLGQDFQDEDSERLWALSQDFLPGSKSYWKQKAWHYIICFWNLNNLTWVSNGMTQTTIKNTCSQFTQEIRPGWKRVCHLTPTERDKWTISE